jgi:hypothetical protein
MKKAEKLSVEIEKNTPECYYIWNDIIFQQKEGFL